MDSGAQLAKCSRFSTLRPNSRIQALTLKILGIAIALAAQVAPFSTTTPQTAIYYWADFYHVDRQELYDTLKCESSFNPNAVGKAGELGISQIFLKYHPEVSSQEALDPDWAIQWTAKQFAAGHADLWVCHTRALSAHSAS